MSGQVVRVGRSLAARGEGEEAFRVLQERYEDLQNDATYLAQLIELALRAKQADSEEAFGWVERRMLMVNSPEELVDATAQALLVARQSGKMDERISRLRSKEKLSSREACLLAELLNDSGEPEAADAVLATAKESAEDDASALLVLAGQARLFGLRKDWGGAAESLRVAVELPGGRKSSTVQMLVDLYQRAAMTEGGAALDQ